MIGDELDDEITDLLRRADQRYNEPADYERLAAALIELL